MVVLGKDFGNSQRRHVTMFTGELHNFNINASGQNSLSIPWHREQCKKDGHFTTSISHR